MNKKKIIYWIIFGFVVLIFVAAIVTGLVGVIKKDNSLIYATPILVSIGILVNIFNTTVFNSKKDNDNSGDKK